MSARDAAYAPGYGPSAATALDTGPFFNLLVGRSWVRTEDGLVVMLDHDFQRLVRLAAKGAGVDPATLIDLDGRTYG